MAVSGSCTLRAVGRNSEEQVMDVIICVKYISAIYLRHCTWLFKMILDSKNFMNIIFAG